MTELISPHGKPQRARLAIGLIAAYALVLQAFFALATVTQAVASGTASGSVFVICHGGADNSTAPAQAVTHCSVCTLVAAGGALVPDAAALPERVAVPLGMTAVVLPDACAQFYQARAGLSRAPPSRV